MVKCRVTAKRFGTIKDLEERFPDLTLATDSEDVRAVKDYFGNRKNIRDFDGFFFNTEEGDYDNLYGFEGTIPEYHKSVYRITMKCGRSKK